MNVSLFLAGLLAAAAGFGHSILGERWILIPLFEGGRLPTTPVGGVRATRSMIRFTWHFFSLVAWGNAAVYFALATGATGNWSLVQVTAACWAVFAVAVLLLSRGRHRAWLLGALVAITAWLGTS